MYLGSQKMAGKARAQVLTLTGLDGIVRRWLAREGCMVVFAF